MNTFTEPIFRGCTRPAMLMGVPMVPALVVTGGFAMAVMWVFNLISPYGALLLILVYAPVMGWMRHVTLQDDQRLRQLLMRARMRLRHGAGRRLWGAVSYSPIRYKARERS